MALLQISEPGMSAAPHQHRLAVGIRDAEPDALRDRSERNHDFQARLGSHDPAQRRLAR